MIKIGIRKNLFYPMMIIIFTFSRSIVEISIEQIYNFDNQIILTLLMFISEFLSGAIFYNYQKKFLMEKNSALIERKSIKSRSTNFTLDTHKSKYKKYILVLACAIFDFSQFALITYFFPKFKSVSESLNIRLKGILIFCSAFFCYFLLKLPILKHQKFSLIIIFINFIIVVFLELPLYQNKKYLNFFIILLLNILRYTFSSILEVTEKYLFEYESLNPLFVVMIEGIFGIILTSIFLLFVDDPFYIFKENNGNKKKLFGLIIFLFLYFIMSGGRNIYRLLTNKIYSPMVKSLTDYSIVPLLIIIYYFIKKDFQVNIAESISIPIFIINLILSFIIVFFCCVYNELFVLYCC